MSVWRSLVRRAFESFGYSVHRWPANRFDGMRDALLLLQRVGYAPRLIIDCGANVGTWTRMARSIFPDAAVHVIEPQPACLVPLDQLARRAGGITVHPVAVTDLGVSWLRLIGGGTAGGGTGAWVARPGEYAPGELECPATTLDSLFADRITREDRALIKLDLEGHELVALRGAARVLQAAELVLTELQFFSLDDRGRPLFIDVLNFLGQRDYEVYDLACLSARPRDMRLRTGDIIFVRRDSPLLADRSWE